MGSRIGGPWRRRGGWGWEWRSMWQWLEFLRRTKNEDEEGVDGVLKRERVFSSRGRDALASLRSLRKTDVEEDERGVFEKREERGRLANAVNSFSLKRDHVHCT